MGFKGFLFIILFAFVGTITAHAQAKVACRNTFAKNTIELTNGEFRTITVSDTKRDLLIFQPTRPSSSAAPVMIYFHGTNSPVELSRPLTADYGLAYENTYIQSLTDAGYIVIAPTANRIVPFYIGFPVVAWEANISPYSSHFERGRDYQLTQHLLKNLEDFLKFPSIEIIFFSRDSRAAVICPVAWHRMQGSPVKFAASWCTPHPMVSV